MSDQTFKDAINDIRKTVSRFQKIEGKPWGRLPENKTCLKLCDYNS